MSHADTYTALELTTAILAALYQREQTGAGQSIDVSMAETMLFVNDHINAELWDGPEDPQAIRNFGPGDYIVFQTADGDSVHRQRPPRRAGHVRRYFLRAFDVEHLADDPRFADVASRKEHIDALRELLARGGREDPRRGDVRGALQRQPPRRRPPAQRPRPRRLGLGRGARGDRRGVRPRRRHDPHPQPAVALQRRRGRRARRAAYRGEDNRAVLADVLGYDDATIDALEADGVLSSRVPSSPG